MKKMITFLILSLFLIIEGQAQVHVAIVDFRNQSEQFYLDSWERIIPDLLRANLSRIDGLIVVDRNRLDTILEEQALSLSGLVNTEQAQEVGKLLGAEFLITGSIHEVNRKIRISADIIRIKTGQVKTEQVNGPDQKHLDKMTSLLANNLVYQLTQNVPYMEEIKLKSSRVWYFLGATTAFAVGAMLTNDAYKENSDNYNQATKLTQFDTYFDRANDYRKITTGLASFAGAAFIGTVISWIQNQNAQTIHACAPDHGCIKPTIFVEANKDFTFGLTIHF